MTNYQDLHRLVDDLVARMNNTRARTSRRSIIAIDGATGAGKTTLAFQLLEKLGNAYVLQTDTYHIPLGAAFRMRPEGETGAMIDWRRLDREALEPAVRDQQVTFTWQNLFDPTEVVTHTVPSGHHLIVDGTFSCRPELTHRYDHTVLVRCPADISTRRRLQRDSGMDEEWRSYIGDIWTADEGRYFEFVTPDDFDFVLDQDPNNTMLSP